MAFRATFLPGLLLLPLTFLNAAAQTSEKASAQPSVSQSSPSSGQNPEPSKPKALPESGEKAATPATPTPLQRAQQLVRQGKLELGQKAVDDLLKDNPGLQDAQLLRADILLHEGDVDGAFEAAKTTLKLAPESPKANLLMGQVLFRRGEFPEANESVQKTLKLAPNDAQAWLALSRIAEVVSLRNKARLCVEKAYSLDPKDPAVMLRWAETRPTRAERIAAYEKFLQMTEGESIPGPQWVKPRIEALKKLGDLETNLLVSPYMHYDIPVDYLLQDAKHLRGWGVDVAIGSCKPAKLMIDTGASGITINRNLAEKCGVKKLYDGFLLGIGDKPAVAAYTALADRVEIGGVQFKNHLIDVEDRRSVADEVGLIGTDVLAKFLINLNLSEYKLSVDPLPVIPGDDGKDGPKDRYLAPEMARYTKIFRVGHELLIPTKVGSDPQPVLFLMDTGSQMNDIALEYIAKVEKLNKEQFIEMKGLQGKVQNVFSADDLILQFAGFKQMNQSLLSMDFNHISHASGVKISGILGMTVLRWFTLHIDYRDGLVGFDYHEPHAVDDRRLR
jgi:Tfp pilus assembly protein PilF